MGSTSEAVREWSLAHEKLLQSKREAEDRLREELKAKAVADYAAWLQRREERIALTKKKNREQQSRDQEKSTKAHNESGGFWHRVQNLVDQATADLELAQKKTSTPANTTHPSTVTTSAPTSASSPSKANLPPKDSAARMREVLKGLVEKERRESKSSLSPTSSRASPNQKPIQSQDPPTQQSAGDPASSMISSAAGSAAGIATGIISGMGSALLKRERMLESNEFTPPQEVKANESSELSYQAFRDEDDNEFAAVPQSDKYF